MNHRSHSYMNYTIKPFLRIIFWQYSYKITILIHIHFFCCTICSSCFLFDFIFCGSLHPTALMVLICLHPIVVTISQNGRVGLVRERLVHQSMHQTGLPCCCQSKQHYTTIWHLHTPSHQCLSVHLMHSKLRGYNKFKQEDGICIDSHSWNRYIQIITTIKSIRANYICCIACIQMQQAQAT